MSRLPSSPSLAKQYEARLWSPTRHRPASRSRKRPKPGSAAGGAARRTLPAKTPPRTPKRRVSDRFIPSRSASLLESGFNILDDEADPVVGAKGDHGAATHSMLVRTELLGAGRLSPAHPATAGAGAGAGAGSGNRGRRFSSPGGASVGSTPGSARRNLFRFQVEREQVRNNLVKQFSLSPLGPASEHLLASPRKPPRKISRTPYKVLDAPSLQDDFYLNLVDWSAENVLAVGLASSVYLWSAHTSKVTRLTDLPDDDCATSVAWTQRGTHLAVGTNTGQVLLFDARTCELVQRFSGHHLRVGAMAWNSYTLATGGRDRGVLLRDVRSGDSYSRLEGHREEVCGLKWSCDGHHLATGGNDNKLLVWSASSRTLEHKFTDHTAAVKAIAWSPHQPCVVASGGGTADRTIRFWNTTTGTALHSVDTGSQVCNIMWSKSVNEVVSSHGYSLNQIIVWKYPSMEKVVTLSGHTYRVLYMAMSPDGQTIVTGAGDETLRFWNVFPGTKVKAGAHGRGTLKAATTTIR